MGTSTVLIQVTENTQAIAPAAEQAREYARRARSESTIRCYKTDWADFSTWCADHQACPLPASPETVASYLATQAENHRPSTIQRRLSAISQVHQVKGHESPTKNEVVRSVLKGIRRTLGTAPAEKAPLLAADVREMVAALPDSLLGKRDRALLLLGFASAMRRSELVGLDVEDLTFTTDGLIVNLRRSKTDQEGAGRKIGVPMLPTSDACPVRALRAWLDASGIADGPVFRPMTAAGLVLTQRLSSHSVALVVKRSLPQGRDVGRFAAHSLRAGFVTSAANGGASVKSIMRTTGHRSLDVLLRYIREASLFKGNALGATGL
ncbi:MAG: site-specific integrase [Bryobacteraceae bacterium]